MGDGDELSWGVGVHNDRCDLWAVVGFGDSLLKRDSSS